MRENYERVFRIVVGHEGGFTDDPNDRGNWTTGVIGQGQLQGTKYGISAMAYPRHDIRSLTVPMARAIYERDYWDRIRGNDLPSGVDLMAFDCAVNQGVRDATLFLQEAADTPADGVIGPNTMRAVRESVPRHLLEEYAALRMNDYMSLKHLTDRYGLGWSRRLMDITVEATTWL